MTELPDELRTGFSTETTMWTSSEAGHTITSTNLHPDFLSQIKVGNTYLDVGCCSERITSEFSTRGAQLVGIDPNLSELELGNRINPKTLYSQAIGEALPFTNDSFDGAVLLATLGAVGNVQREAILNETVRCIKPGGTVYVAEFARIRNPLAQTSDGKKWQTVYKDDGELLGEDGSVRVLRPDGTVRYICHHFKEDEIMEIFTRNGLDIAACKRVRTQSTVSGLMRPNWNIWGIKS